MKKPLLASSFKRKRKKSEEGMAIIEAIPVLFMLGLVFNFALGFFGAIHSGVLNSMASYNYTLETFRFRSNLVYFRPGADSTTHYEKAQNRVHGTVQDGSEDSGSGDSKQDSGRWPATLRPITFNYKDADKDKFVPGGESSHLFSSSPTGDNVWAADSDYKPQDGDSIQRARVWIKTVYGICLNAECKK